MAQVCIYVCDLLFCVVSSGVAAFEPACSKYDFEEKFLERLIKMEFTMDKILNENKAVSDQMKEEVDKIRNENKALSDQTKQELENNLNENKAVSDQMKQESGEFLTSTRSSLDEVIQLAKDNGTPFVFFHASSPTDTSPSSGDTIKFSDVQTNEGLGYDDNTGNFTAPVSGLYMLFMQLCANGDLASLQIVKEASVLIASTYYGTAGYAPCSSAHVVTRLVVGESVWVKSASSSKLYHSSSLRWTSFGGALVHI